MNTTAKRTFPPDNDGTATVDDEGRAVIRFERALSHPIDRVWAAITEPDQIERILGSGRRRPPEDASIRFWQVQARPAPGA